MTSPGGTEVGVKFTSEEVSMIKDIVRRDEFMRELQSSQKAAKVLSDIVNASGPVSLFIKWNQELIKGWAQANSNLGVIAKKKTCDDLSYLENMTTDTSKSDLFGNMQRIRGCE